MIQFIIGVLGLILLYCIILWLIGIVDNAGETRVMSLRTFYRLLKNNKVRDIDMYTGVTYRDDGYNDCATPRWTWYPLFMAMIIGDALHKEVI